MKHKLVYITSIIITLICLSCQKREAYYHFKELKDMQWSKLDTLSFDIDSSAIVPGIPYDIHFELVNTTEYKYRNLWLHIQDNFNGIQFVPHEYEYILADGKGDWYGDGFGSIYQLSVIYRKNVVFKESRNYTLKIVQAMRDEPLFGLEKIGLKIDPSNH